MAFTIMKKTLPPLLILLCLNITTNKTEAVNIREKCMCIQQTEGVVWRRVKDFNVIHSGPHCNKDQIIIKMQSKSVCLAPNSKQGKKLQKCWKGINFNEKKKKACLQQRKVKRNKKSPKRHNTVKDSVI